MKPVFRPPRTPFMGARFQIAPLEPAPHAALFGAPHGTPYAEIDNRPHASAPETLRGSFGDDADWTDHWDFDFDGLLLGDGSFRLADLGDLRTSPKNGRLNRAQIEAATRLVLDTGAVPIMIGGDDSTPIPFLAAFDQAGPVTIVQIDAHIDWRDERRGERMGFSSTMRRASEMAHVERIIQVGIRGFGSARREEVEFARAWGAKIITAREVHRTGVEAAIAHIPEGARCVVTIDCDALDPAVMPAVAAPTPGGLSYTQVIDLLAWVVRKGVLAGLDLIEFVPARDPSGTAAITAARIISNAVGLMANAGRRTG